ncbi:MAG: DUF4006 family protein [Campylobacterota bacterium]
MNENRNIFGINGISGMLIATVLLLAILGFLTFLAIGAQQNNAENFYKLENPMDIKMIGADNVDHVVKADQKD